MYVVMLNSNYLLIGLGLNIIKYVKIRIMHMYVYICLFIIIKIIAKITYTFYLAVRNVEQQTTSDFVMRCRCLYPDITKADWVLGLG